MKEEAMEQVLLQTKGLKKYFDTPAGKLHAVDGIDISIDRGSTLGVVGESGCGKSTLGRLVLRLIPATEGQVTFNGIDLLTLSDRDMHKMRRELQMIFQDPYSSLNPRMCIRDIIGEALIVNKLMKDPGDVSRKVGDLMDTVGIARRLAYSYPHELDGGRRQRVGIARALAVNPKFIVCDEPVSSLDVSIQAQIINLLMDLQKEYNLTYMFISHDLSVVRHISRQIMVMYLGECVEMADAKGLFKNPLHPYTQALLKAIPIPSLKYRGHKREILSGEVTSPINLEEGCRFYKRCPYAKEACQSKLRVIEVEDNHYVRCLLYE